MVINSLQLTKSVIYGFIQITVHHSVAVRIYAFMTKQIVTIPHSLTLITHTKMTNINTTIRKHGRNIVETHNLLTLKLNSGRYGVWSLFDFVC